MLHVVAACAIYALELDKQIFDLLDNLGMMHAENRCLASGFPPLRTTCTHVLPVLEAACPEKRATIFCFVTFSCIDRFQQFFHLPDIYLAVSG